MKKFAVILAIETVQLFYGNVTMAATTYNLTCNGNAIQQPDIGETLCRGTIPSQNCTSFSGSVTVNGVTYQCSGELVNNSVGNPTPNTCLITAASAGGGSQSDTLNATSQCAAQFQTYNNNQNQTTPPK